MCERKNEFRTGDYLDLKFSYKTAERFFFMVSQLVRSQLSTCIIRNKIMADKLMSMMIHKTTVIETFGLNDPPSKIKEKSPKLLETMNEKTLL